MKTEKEERRAKEKLLNVKKPELDEFENKMFSQFLFLQMVNSTEEITSKDQLSVKQSKDDNEVWL